jgi:hypothetical protein
MEDGAPGHKGFSKQYTIRNGMDSIQWPAQSPDLNPIEALWLDMENELGETWGSVADLGTLEVALNTVWQAIPTERLESLIQSMPAQLQAVIDAEGGATRY